MIYLVQFELETQRYPDSRIRESLTRLVQADNKEQAEAKLLKHYDDQSEPYLVSYWVRGVTVHPTIS